MYKKLKKKLQGVVGTNSYNIGVLVGSDLSEWAPTRWGTVTVKKIISYCYSDFWTITSQLTDKVQNNKKLHTMHLSKDRQE